MEGEFKIEHNSVHKNKVHRVLAHSYFVYFLLFLVGISLDIFFRFKVLSNFLTIDTFLNTEPSFMIGLLFLGIFLCIGRLFKDTIAKIRG